MKATGIVRRIDDLGRVVIPKKSQDTPYQNRRPIAEHMTQEIVFCSGMQELTGRGYIVIMTDINSRPRAAVL